MASERSALWVLDVENSSDEPTDIPARRVEAPFRPWEVIAAGNRVAVVDRDHTKLAFWNPVDDTWTQAADAAGGPRMLWGPRPPGGIVHWTGSQLVIWGGVGTPVAAEIPPGTRRTGPTRPPISLPRPDGAAYDPIANTWKTISNAPITPPVAAPFASVWAGDRLFAWSPDQQTIHAAEWGSLAFDGPFIMNC